MNINDMTVGQVREIAGLFRETAPVGSQVQIESSLESHPYEVGAGYFIRTVTHHYTGVIVEDHQTELVLTDAAWIADDGRFSAAVANGEFSEVEPYPNSARVIIGRGSILDAVKVPYKMPRSQK